MQQEDEQAIKLCGRVADSKTRPYMAEATKGIEDIHIVRESMQALTRQGDGQQLPQPQKAAEGRPPEKNERVQRR